MEFIFCLQFYQRYASLQVLFKIFVQIYFVVIYKEMFAILRTSVSQKTFQQQRAANRFKVLQIFISLKVTVYMQDHRLRSEKALDAQGYILLYTIYIQLLYIYIHNCYIYIYIYIQLLYIYSKTQPSSLLHIQQSRIQNPFLSKQGVISLEVTIFTKYPSQMFEKVLNTLLPSKP